MIDFVDERYDREWDLYGKWLSDQIFGRSGKKINDRLREVMYIMHRTPFRYEVHMDYNREEDGRCLRNRYKPFWEVFRREEPLVSVLEVLVAFAIRIDREYTGDPGDPKPDDVFNMFVKNLGLMTSQGLHPGAIHDLITRWLEREYGPNGEGGLFYVKDCEYDMSKEELWRQMNIWVSSNLFKDPYFRKG